MNKLGRLARPPQQLQGCSASQRVLFAVCPPPFPSLVQLHCNARGLHPTPFFELAGLNHHPQVISMMDPTPQNQIRRMCFLSGSASSHTSRCTWATVILSATSLSHSTSMIFTSPLPSPLYGNFRSSKGWTLVSTVWGPPRLSCASSKLEMRIHSSGPRVGLCQGVALSASNASISPLWTPSRSSIRTTPCLLAVLACSRSTMA